MNCKKCRTPMIAAVARRIEGRTPNMNITVSDFPYLTCPSCQSNAFVHADFPEGSLTPIADAAPIANTGLLGKNVTCCACKSPLEGFGAAEVSVNITTQVRNQFPLTVEIRAAGFSCPACGQRQLRGRRDLVTSDIADALISAFDSLGPLNRW